MTSNYKTMVVVNPRSANGSTGKKWPAIEAEIRKHLDRVDCVFTSRPMEAVELTGRALKEGYEMVVGVGGDGTINEVVNGFFEDDRLINEGAVAGIISMGTGSDLIKTLGIPKEVGMAAARLAGRALRSIDVGKVDFMNNEGKEERRYFINIADVGVGGETVERVNSTTKAFGGLISFMWGAFISLLTYKNKKVRIRVDDHFDEELIINSINICNGRYYGGGMKIAPDAAPDDGLFDVIIMGDLTTFESLRNGLRIYKGTHINHPKVTCLRGRKVMLTSDEKVLMDMEGEQPGIIPATFEIIPGAIKFKV